ncbi:hypothetical protein CPU12_10815 [Malaciobacter molluscorum LMG 25693]|uniref:Protein nucleotidyltransferase YdiU n=1 Tax=Malaciobacter molluscorum LMG 25693 TaxID=870501 RepID=A0A2G1DFX2_9BACT|nr:YdiU family protein [Malaciobacter molluscorum]AXX91703.1 YdiU family protein [Malaciobacter molluscorum LMG 25693]PHO17408.1 hypothetical protein CPU12_10815 [Malaciobacter molluscorum LMG 25693]
MKLDELEFQTKYLDSVDKKFYQLLDATALDDAFLISYNKKLCDEIELDYKECETKDFVDFINGKKVLKGSIPYSMVYAGHQFGQFVPKLGDGRAINLGSIKSWHLQTKGSGLTNYSRQGDGRAVLRSSIREYIISEAMYALNIPTTRALAIIGSDHDVYRGPFEIEKGAVVLRASSSWIRIGTFEFFARSEDPKKNLTSLADFVISENYKHLENDKNKYEKFFYELVDKTALLIAKWQVYGFMHGVMNTDNMSVDGISIDYGPFSFMDYFEKHYICNHTDVEGRYSYNNQPYIAKWNLFVLADSLSFIADFENLQKYLKNFFSLHEEAYLELMNERLGLDINLSGDRNLDLIIRLLKALEESKIDYNFFFYLLSKIENPDDFASVLDNCIYPEHMKKWIEDYKRVLLLDPRTHNQRCEEMSRVNPKYIIKNYILEEAIKDAQNDDFKLVNDLLNIAQNPFSEHKEFERYSKATPLKYANIKLSCSS